MFVFICLINVKGDNMTYTERVREYCENNKGGIIDISKVKDEEFSEILYKFRCLMMFIENHKWKKTCRHSAKDA